MLGARVRIQGYAGRCLECVPVGKFAEERKEEKGLGEGCAVRRVPLLIIIMFCQLSRGRLLLSHKRRNSTRVNEGGKNGLKEVFSR